MANLRDEIAKTLDKYECVSEFTVKEAVDEMMGHFDALLAEKREGIEKLYVELVKPIESGSYLPCEMQEYISKDCVLALLTPTNTPE